MADLTRRQRVDRQPVLVSGEAEVKLLSVQKYIIIDWRNAGSSRFRLFER